MYPCECILKIRPPSRALAPADWDVCVQLDLLKDETASQTLNNAFSRFGTVTEVKFIKDRRGVIHFGGIVDWAHQYLLLPMEIHRSWSCDAPALSNVVFYLVNLFMVQCSRLVTGTCRGPQAPFTVARLQSLNQNRHAYC